MINKAALVCGWLLMPLLAGASTLDLYSDLVGKTLLIAPGLPNPAGLPLADLPADRTNAIARIEGELTKSGIALVPDGPHFVRILPLHGRETFLKEAPLAGSELLSSADQEILPAGMLNFPATDVSQILVIYAELTRRTVLRSCALPSPTIQFKTACPLSRKEVIYGLNTVFAFNGIAMVDDGDSFVQAVAMPQRGQINCQAPKRDPRDRLFDPKKVPTVGVRNSAAPVSKLELEFERLEAAFYQFIYHQGPPRRPQRPAFRLLEFEAELTHKTAVASKQFDGMGVSFDIRTPLSKSELIYAIETSLKLANLAVIPVDDHSIRLGHISEAGTKSRE